MFQQTNNGKASHLNQADRLHPIGAHVKVGNKRVYCPDCNGPLIVYNSINHISKISFCVRCKKCKFSIEFSRLHIPENMLEEERRKQKQIEEKYFLKNK